MDISINKSALPNSDVQLHKRRRKKSMVWEHFTIKTTNPDCVRAFCNHCEKPFAHMSGSKASGTSHLKRHILGICPVGRNKLEKDQVITHVPPPVNGTNIPRKRCRASNGVTSTYFDGDSCTYNSLAKMVIQHGYPLAMVEDSGFIDFTRGLQPQFNLPSTSLLHEQIMGIYLKEKQKLAGIVSGIPGCLNLTVDLCNSNQSSAYVQITGQFTDHEWKLQRRVFNVVTAEFPDSEAAFTHAIAACLCDWAIADRVFTVTLDLTHANQSVRENLRNLLPIKNSLILEGQLLIKSCYAHTLRSLAQDAVASMRDTVQKVRHSVKYVKTSVAHEKRFIDVKRQLQVPSTKNLTIDDSKKWNTTYHMLVAACEMKEVFSCLDTCDPDYKSTLSMEEWRQVETLCSYLKIFYEAACILTSPVYPTTNSFFDVVWKIYFELLHAAVSKDSFVSTLTTPLLEIFTKYWDDCNLVLAIAVVMDPRFKMKFVEFSFSRIYGEDAEAWIKIVNQGLHDLYLDYLMLSFTPPMVETEQASVSVSLSVSPQDELLSGDDGGFDFDVDVSDILGDTKSELEVYLEESVMPRVQDFDVLGWWRLNKLRFPTLSKLASDVLSVPVSTVPPESVFDSGERKMDSYLSSLKPKTVEALICAKDWFRHSSTMLSLPESHS